MRVWLLALLHADRRSRVRAAGGASRALLAGAVTLQAALGIVTLLYQAPLALALAHQAMAIVVFTIAVVHRRAAVASRGSVTGVPPCAARQAA